MHLTKPSKYLRWSQYLVGRAWPEERKIESGKVHVRDADATAAEYWSSGPARVIKEFDRSVTGVQPFVAFSGDNKSIALGMRDGTLRLWDMRSGNPSTVSSDGTYVATQSSDGISVWAPTAIEADEKRRLTQAHYDLVLQASFSPGGTRIVTASYDKTVSVWDSATASRIQRRHESTPRWS